ncbi:hypothetical protein GBA52_020292 [Prunus armeniaca]|nr:hypothetical protein GBA52_020292 [Prunus armeniaca]
MVNMKSPATTKEIQSLTGRATALNCFLSRSTDKCMPFFKALKKGHKNKWDDECEVAFQNLKTYLSSLPLLSKPILGEDLYIYLAVSDLAVSSALIREELGAQHPVFYTSKALLDAETHYPKIEKLIFSLVVSARKLRPYYQAHRIIVIIEFPLRSILHSPNASQLGYRTQSLRPPLPAKNCYKSPSFNRFCCKVYSDSRRREDGHEKQGKSRRHLPHRFEPT